jgi:hypothetical protein
MKYLSGVLMLILVALLTLCVAFPCKAQEPVAKPEPSYLSTERFGLSAGLGQRWTSPALKNFADQSPESFGWGKADYTINDKLMAGLSVDRALNNSQDWQARLVVGWKFTKSK